jgi:hypothetical protein
VVVILPGDADRWGGLGGKAGEVEVLGFPGNPSLELRLRTVSSGRGRSRRSEAQTKTRTCQGDAQGREKGSRA